MSHFDTDLGFLFLRIEEAIEALKEASTLLESADLLENEANLSINDFNKRSETLRKCMYLVGLFKETFDDQLSTLEELLSASSEELIRIKKNKG